MPNIKEILDEIGDSVPKTDINGTGYPVWAVERGQGMMDKDENFTNLESLVQAILLVDWATRHAIPADPSGPGYAFTPGIHFLLRSKK